MLIKNLKQNYPLKNLTTFKIGGPAKYFVEVDDTGQLPEVFEFVKEKDLQVLFLSGGSNVVISDKGFDGLVLKINNKGFEVIQEDEKHIWLKVGAGELWDGVVQKAVENDWWGIENLSGIPGRAGAFVVQNAGAYGQECADVLEKVEVYSILKGEFKMLTKDECGFGYRKSIFNTTQRGQLVIMSVFLKFKKNGQAQADYPDVKRYFNQNNISHPGLREIRKAIIQIRRTKLPNWGQFGNCGSFFKNLLLTQDEYQVLHNHLKKNFDQRVVDKIEDFKNKFSCQRGIKVPAAFLLDICGLKGLKLGQAQVHDQQPLVLMSQGDDASAYDVLNLFKKVRQTVYQKTGMQLEPEPSFIGFNKAELEKYFELE